MRPELELIQTIEQYLSNQLSAVERASFEDRMQDDPSLQEDVELQEELLDGLENLELKSDVEKSFDKFQFGKTLNLGIGIFLAVAITGAAVFL